MAQVKYPAHGAPPTLAMPEDLPLREDRRRTAVQQGHAQLAGLPEAAGAPQAIELRHLRKVFTKLEISSRLQLQRALPDGASAGPMA